MGASAGFQDMMGNSCWVIYGMKEEEVQSTTELLLLYARTFVV